MIFSLSEYFIFESTVLYKKRKLKFGEKGIHYLYMVHDFVGKPLQTNLPWICIKLQEARLHWAHSLQTLISILNCYEPPLADVNGCRFVKSNVNFQSFSQSFFFWRLLHVTCYTFFTLNVFQKNGSQFSR